MDFFINLIKGFFVAKAVNSTEKRSQKTEKIEIRKEKENNQKNEIRMKEEKKRKKIMTFIVATNVIASRPPERRPTGTPHARANNRVRIMWTRVCQETKKIKNHKCTPFM